MVVAGPRGPSDPPTMSVIYIVLPLALLLGGTALAAFLWAVRKGQFDDLETPAIRIALEDDVAPVPRPGAAPSRDRAGPSAVSQGDPARHDRSIAAR